MNDDKKLVFIYNANSGVISTIKDFWKKILRPSSYQCNLCTQTFGVFSMKKDWKEFIKRLKINVEFLHRDEFEEKYKIDDAKYPSAYLKQNEILSLLITQEEIDSVKSLDEMETLVLGKINTLN
ncbi:hypothetical protein LCGC14_2135310 [marine sediment metagenome]|uniref:GTPase n=1 Tax=marine sediment metagenome TaxID=412755 RepID=A0A0F9E058_9ZZZZ